MAAAQALVCSNSGGGGGVVSVGGLTTEVQGGANTVLRVIIESMLYPVTLDVLYQIFSRVGKVLRIVTFTKSGFFQALIQYPDVVMAQAAKLVSPLASRCQVPFGALAKVTLKYAPSGH